MIWIDTTRFCINCEIPTAETEWHEGHKCGFPLHTYADSITIQVRK